MKVLRKAALVFAATMAIVLPRPAEAVIYNLSSSAGTVTVTESGGNLNFDVLLSGTNVFLDSAANNLDAFVFNVNTAPAAITNISLFPTPNGSSSAVVDSTLPQIEGIFGSFTNGLTF